MADRTKSPPESPGQADWRAVLVVVLLVSAVYTAGHLWRGWMPFDDGALAQSAERLAQGELPHRDFDEIYTGGLTWLNAAAFRILGTTLGSLRVVLFAAFIAWVPAVFYIASRFARPLAAAAVTFLGVVWSLPNYTAAMPSWYNLFLAAFGIAAVFRYLEDGRRRWLVVAGVAAGLSFLVKVIGIYDIAAVLLFLVFHAHEVSPADAQSDDQRSYTIAVSLALLLFAGVLVVVVRRQLHPSEVVHFVLPGVLIAGFLIRAEWMQPRGGSRERFAALARLAIPFLVGVALPVVPFLFRYSRAASLGALFNGVFVLPMRRFGLAYGNAPELTTMFALIPVVVLGVLAHRSRKLGLGRPAGVFLAAILALLLIATGRSDALYRAVWSAARSLVPALVVVGLAVLCGQREASATQPRLRGQAMLLLIVTALCSLVQFPYDAPNYFCYIAPLVGLTALALYAFMVPTRPAVGGLVVAFFIAFAVLRTNFRPLQQMGFSYRAPFPMAPLPLERAGISVPDVHAAVYAQLVPMLRARARGEYTWASPDSPEIYFLSGLKNPTRALFDFLDDSSANADFVIRTLDSHNVTAIVLNSSPAFSAGISREMFSRLASRYPHSQMIGPFQVRWRE